MNLTTVVKRTDLLERLQTNLKQHKKMHEEAVAGYCKEAAEHLEKILAELRKGNPVTVRLPGGCERPLAHCEAYERAIKMVEATTADTITLDENDFMTLMEDSWDWTHHWCVSNAKFSSTTADYARRKRLPI